MLRGIPLKTLEQKAHREAKKRIESQRHPEFLALSSKILAFLSRHTTHINAMHASCHNTTPLLEEPKPLRQENMTTQNFIFRHKVEVENIHS